MSDKELLVKDLIIALLPEAKISAGRLEELIENVTINYSVSRIKETALSTGDGNTTKYLVEAFVKDKLVKGLSDKSIKAYVHGIQKLYVYSKKELNLLTKDDITSYLNYYRYSGEGNKPNTVKNRYLHLSTFYGWLYSNHYIAENPMVNVAPPKSYIPQKEIITVGEMERITIACENKQEGVKKARSLAICYLLYESGLRVSELANLRLTDIDWVKNKITVRSGKGNKSRVTFFGDKSKERLMEYLNLKKGNSEYLFTKLYYAQPMLPSGLERLVKEVGRMAEIPRLHPHLFRTTFATNLINKGVSVSVVRVLLGHSSLSTLNSYVMLSESEILHSIKNVM